MTIKYGFFSAKAAIGRGWVVYLNEQGEEVAVTAVYNEPDGSDYHWDDKICKGVVTNYVREVRLLTEEYNEKIKIPPKIIKTPTDQTPL